MRYKDALARSLDIYHSIYHCEYDVLNHMFFVLGNGYEWQNGELVSDNDHLTKQSIFDQIMNDYGIDMNEPAKYSLECRVISKHTLYPISLGAAIMNIPDDVKDDWLVAANRALYMATSINQRPQDTKYLLEAKDRINQIVKDRQKVLVL